MQIAAPNMQCFLQNVVQPLAAAGIFNGASTAPPRPSKHRVVMRTRRLLDSDNLPPRAGSAYCNGPLVHALYFANTTVLTSVSGELLDPTQYACKLAEPNGENVSSWDTWTFPYASTPADVLTPAGAALPLAVRA